MFLQPALFHVSFPGLLPLTHGLLTTSPPLEATDSSTFSRTLLKTYMFLHILHVITHLLEPTI